MTTETEMTCGHAARRGGMSACLPKKTKAPVPLFWHYIGCNALFNGKVQKRTTQTERNWHGTLYHNRRRRERQDVEDLRDDEGRRRREAAYAIMCGVSRTWCPETLWDSNGWNHSLPDWMLKAVDRFSVSQFRPCSVCEMSAARPLLVRGVSVISPFRHKPVGCVR